jgi:hypothetical protein
VVSLLQTLRAAVGRTMRAPDARTLSGRINVVLPVPGDVRGLAPGTQFERDALAVSEAVIITNPDDPATTIGLVPEFTYGDFDSDDAAEAPELCALSWMVYSLPGAPVLDHYELGDAEYALRSAVRSAADALGTIGLGSAASDVANPRGLVEQMLESSRQHRVPEHAPSRAVRVLENAAHVDAIIAVSAGLSRLPTGNSSSETQIANNALRPLTAVVRSARMAAASAILRSAWSD